MNRHDDNGVVVDDNDDEDNKGNKAKVIPVFS
jgi:hypothetical protein